MNYSSLGMIATYVQWIVRMGLSVIIFRCLFIMRQVFSSDENVSFWSVLSKVKNHVTAMIIAVSADALVAFIKSYLL